MKWNVVYTRDKPEKILHKKIKFFLSAVKKSSRADQMPCVNDPIIKQLQLYPNQWLSSSIFYTFNFLFLVQWRIQQKYTKHLAKQIFWLLLEIFQFFFCVSCFIGKSFRYFRIQSFFRCLMFFVEWNIRELQKFSRVSRVSWIDEFITFEWVTADNSSQHTPLLSHLMFDSCVSPWEINTKFDAVWHDFIGAHSRANP